jgi:hypothetical protein
MFEINHNAPKFWILIILDDRHYFVIFFTLKLNVLKKALEPVL